MVNNKARRYHNVLLIFVNWHPIILYSKRNITVERSKLSSEFVTLKAEEEVAKQSFGIKMVIGHEPSINSNN